MDNFLFIFSVFLLLMTPNLYCEKIMKLNLEKAVHTGLKNNRELMLKRKENMIAEKELKLKYRNYFPDFKLSYSDSANVLYRKPDTYAKKLSLSLTQDIYDRGRKKTTINLGKKQLSLEKLKTKDAEDDYVFQIISSFMEILKLDMETAILEKTFVNTSLQLEIGKKEAELGEITVLNLFEMEIANNDIELLVGEKKNEKEKMIFSFSRLLALKTDVYPEVMGRVNTEYNGFVEEDFSFFINAANKKSTLYREKLLEGETAYQNYKTASRENIPDIKADCSFSMSGHQFPLTEPGLDISLTLSFDKAGFPSSVTAGISREEMERSRTVTAETRPLSEIENIYLKESLSFALDKTMWGIENFKISNDFSIREMILDIESLKKELLLMRRKLEIQKNKTEIEKLQLKLGEIKRIDYIQSSIEFAKEKINLIDCIASLYQKEISLLRLCGIKNIIRTGGDFILNDE